MDHPQLDVIVGDGGIGSLAVGYLLAARGRTVGIVETQARLGTSTVTEMDGRRVDPLHDLVETASIIGRRSALVLLPEGALSVSLTSERYLDAGHAVAIVDLADASEALRQAIFGLGGQPLAAGGRATWDDSGQVSGYRDPEGSVTYARCSIVASEDIERLTELPVSVPTVPADYAIETEWRFTLDDGSISARFGMASGSAAEWWVYGDPFDGAGGVGRLRAHGHTIGLAVILPLDQVLQHRLDVADLGDRLRSHVSIAPLLVGAVAAGPVARTIRIRPMIGALVGDGWVAAPTASPFGVAPCSTELAMAEDIALSLHEALGSAHVSAARLAAVGARMRATATAASVVPLGPIDGWADELEAEPTGLVEGARLMAKRFSAAG